MLWYKAWRETRKVTLVGIIAMAIACVLIIYNQQLMRDHADAPMTYIAYIYKAVYNSMGRDIFIILSIILGSGGLLQEKSVGTVGFTLSLPASRTRILLWRAVVGYLGVLAIAITPVIVVPLGSRYLGQSYPLGQAFGFFVLWSACGALFYGYTFLLAHVLEGEHTSILLAIPSLMLYGVLMGLPWLARFPMLNIFDIVNGEDMPFFDERLRMLVGPLPWLTLVVIPLVAMSFVFTASRRMQPRDF
jgi:ABC-type transport system involved in multi-copper enzyme maturation permease subunit